MLHLEVDIQNLIFAEIMCTWNGDGVEKLVSN